MGNEYFVLQVLDHFSSLHLPAASCSASVLQRCHRPECSTGRVKLVYVAIFVLITIDSTLQLTVLKCFDDLTVETQPCLASIKLL